MSQDIQARDLKIGSGSDGYVAVTGTGTLADPFIFKTQLTATPTIDIGDVSILPITYTKTAGTITTGGTSQQALAANSATREVIIFNPPDATNENLYIGLGTAATLTSLCIANGMAAVIQTSQAIHVLAATTGHAWTVEAGV